MTPSLPIYVDLEFHMCCFSVSIELCIGTATYLCKISWRVRGAMASISLKHVLKDMPFSLCKSPQCGPAFYEGKNGAC